MRPTGELIGIASAVELVVDVDADTDRARTVRTVEPLPLGLAHLAVPGTNVGVVVADASGDVMIEWSR